MRYCLKPTRIMLLLQAWLIILWAFDLDSMTCHVERQQINVVSTTKFYWKQLKLRIYVCTFSMNDAKLKIIEALKMMTPLIPNNKSPSGSNKTSKPELVLVWDIEKRTKIRLVAIWWVTSKLTSILTAIMLVMSLPKNFNCQIYWWFKIQCTC